MEVKGGTSATSSSLHFDSQFDGKDFVVIDVGSKDINVSLSLMMSVYFDIFGAIELGSGMTVIFWVMCALDFAYMCGGGAIVCSSGGSVRYHHGAVALRIWHRRHFGFV